MKRSRKDLDRGNDKQKEKAAGSIHRWLSGSRQLGRLVLVFRLGVPLRCKASKLEYPLRIPPLVKKRGNQIDILCLQEVEVETGYDSALLEFRGYNQKNS